MSVSNLLGVVGMLIVCFSLGYIIATLNSIEKILKERLPKKGDPWNR